MNSNQTNNAFELAISLCARRYRSALPACCTYSPETLADRLMQRVTEITLPAFAKFCKTRAPGEALRLETFLAVKTERMTLDIPTGLVRQSAVQWLRNQFEFLMHWFFCLYSIVACVFVRGTARSTVLAYGIAAESIFQDGLDNRFVEYCRNSPVAPLRDADQLIVQYRTGQKSSSAQFEYALRPILALLRNSGLTPGQGLQLLARHIRLICEFAYASCRSPACALLSKDFPYVAITRHLDRTGVLQSLVFTCSDYYWQPLWSRDLENAQTHMVWYAQNWKPISYAADRTESNSPYIRWIRVDTHWVWTAAFARYIGNCGHTGEIRAIGPVVWTPVITAHPDPGKLNILIFDISPFSDEVALNHGQSSNYNNPANLFRFIDDILASERPLEIAFEKPVRFSLKTKRAFHPESDADYFGHLQDLAGKGKLVSEAHTANPFELISRNDLVIVYPYSSPAYIADHVGVPSIYYDPTGSIVAHHFGDAGSQIRFANSPEKLVEIMIATLQSVQHQPAGRVCNRTPA